MEESKEEIRSEKIETDHDDEEEKVYSECECAPILLAEDDPFS